MNGTKLTGKIGHINKELEALEKELNLMQQQKDNLLHKQARAKTDNEIKYWQFRIDKFNEKIGAFTNIKQRLEAIDNANPSEALKLFEEFIKIFVDNIVLLDTDLQMFNTIKNYILKAQEQEKLKVDICEMFGLDNLFPYNDTKAILKELEEYMDRKNQLWVDFMKTSKELKEQEKENELLKEIIKSLFDRGCPLHQYADSKFGLTIEVDDECSIMHLGEYKGVDLDKKLKEVLGNE